MSTPNANDQKTAPPPSSGLSIGLIVGGIVLALIIIGVVIYVIKRRQNGGSANVLSSGPPTATNGLGAMNQGSNAVPRTTMNVNAGRTTV
jgi:hypothetical protein